jgi:hypothetical protein
MRISVDACDEEDAIEHAYWELRSSGMVEVYEVGG